MRLPLRRIFARPQSAPPAPRPPVPRHPQELAWADATFFGGVPLERWNPDELIWHRGHGVYRRMLQDDQVQALVALRRNIVAGRGWFFDHPADSPRHARCAEFFAFLLTEQLEGTFAQALADLLSAQSFGYSILEKLFAPVSWRGSAWWGLRALKRRPAESFHVRMDAYGNVAELLQEQEGRPVALPRERFIHHVNRPEVHPFYGESDLKACHRHWWAKDNILKFWNIYLERMASGFVHGRIAGPLNAGEREELKQVMRNLSAQTSIITPANVELQMVTAPSTDAFERAVAARDKAMARALLVPPLLGYGEQSGAGSYAQSRTQLDTFLMVMGTVAEGLADTLNEQLFRELGWWNFGLVNPPRFRFEPLTAQQRREAAQSWQSALAGGTVHNTPADEARTRALLGYPAAHAG